MEYIVDAKEAKEIDRISIQEIGIPSMVLMEKASMAVASCIMAEADSLTDRVLAVCGTGNNGGDGVAAARLLKESDFDVSVLVLGQKERCTEEMRQQIKIAEQLNVPVFWDNLAEDAENNGVSKMTITETRLREYSIIVDAIFGIGLARPVTGKIARYIQAMNQSGRDIVAVDIPSGIHADNGKVLGQAVHARVTVTFGNTKRGLLLYPGMEYAGQVIVADIGFPQKAVAEVSPKAFTFKKETVGNYLPDRKRRSHKGSYGKTLVIAGSPDMSGACYLAAKAAYRMGCGLVQVVTASENAVVIRTKLPEAIVTTWSEAVTQDEEEALVAGIQSAAAVVIGPGLGQSEGANRLVDITLRELSKMPNKPVVIDADGLNILSGRGEYHTLGKQFVLTPHMREMSRLTGKEIDEISENMIETVTGQQGGATVVLKDARTLVSDGASLYINTSGNSGLATGGSGDVLSGIIGGLLAQGMIPFQAASLGVCLHGLAAEQYTEKFLPHSMLAGDILEMLPEVLASIKK
ncbi:MAG: NAD(P)H-hydrate dehydratase [Lachnospiraceae bacterium]|nr:NAD(P)H-hydrate dehydratase [Lachnospiraceae bacterium]